MYLKIGLLKSLEYEVVLIMGKNLAAEEVDKNIDQEEHINDQKKDDPVLIAF